MAGIHALEADLLGHAITVECAASSSAQVNTVGFSPLAGSRINAETACDVLFANAVAKTPPIRPVPITTIFFTLLLLGLALSGLAVAV